MKKLTRLEQLYCLQWFLKEQIKTYTNDLKGVEEEIKILEKVKSGKYE